MTEAAVSEALIADLKAKTGRSCGSCSLCCKLLKVNDPALSKPAGQWCPHCRPGNGGCAIYDQRPGVCRGWACGWLVYSTLGDDWRPTRSKMVVYREPINGDTRRIWCNILVDPDTPNAWRREPYHSQIRKGALIGLRGLHETFIITRVGVGRRVFVILPDDDVEVTGECFTVAPVGPDQWVVFTFKSKEQLRKWETLTAIAAAVAKRDRNAHGAQAAATFCKALGRRRP